MNALSPSTVASLVCHAHVDMALSCLGSLITNSGGDLRIRIHDDGSLTNADRERLNQGLPDSTFVSPENADDVVLPVLARYPECRAFRIRSVLARKLLDAPLFAAKTFLFCDSDVLWMRPFAGLTEFPDATAKVTFMSDHQEAYALRPWDLVGSNALRVPRRVNTGLISANTEILDLDFLEWLLALGVPAFSRFPLWAEQTCWAALGQRAGCRLWDVDQIRVVRDSECLKAPLVAGHFTSSVRSLMPIAKSECSGHDPSRVKLRTVRSEPLGFLSLACAQLTRYCRRLLGNR